MWIEAHTRDGRVDPRDPTTTQTQTQRTLAGTTWSSHLCSKLSQSHGVVAGSLSFQKLLLLTCLFIEYSQETQTLGGDAKKDGKAQRKRTDQRTAPAGESRNPYYFRSSPPSPLFIRSGCHLDGGKAGLRHFEGHARYRHWQQDRAFASVRFYANLAPYPDLVIVPKFFSTRRDGCATKQPDAHVASRNPKSIPGITIPSVCYACISRITTDTTPTATAAKRKRRYQGHARNFFGQ